MAFLAPLLTRLSEARPLAFLGFFPAATALTSLSALELLALAALAVLTGRIGAAMLRALMTRRGPSLRNVGGWAVVTGASDVRHHWCDTC